MDAALYPEIQKHSFFRTPAWRWERAKGIIDHGRKFSSRRDDLETKRAVDYLRAWNCCRSVRRAEKLATEFPDFFAAHLTHEEGGRTRLELQARLLARQTPEGISKHLGMSAEVINTFESLFFNINDRLDERDWIVLRAIGWWAFDPIKGRSPEVVLKGFAYHGGPLILATVLPYLIDRQGLARLMDHFGSAEHPENRKIRLTILSEMLPWTQKSDQLLLRAGLSLRELAKTRSPTRLIHAKLARTAAETLETCAIDTIEKVSEPPATGSCEDIEQLSWQTA